MWGWLGLVSLLSPCHAEVLCSVCWSSNWFCEDDRGRIFVCKNSEQDRLSVCAAPQDPCIFYPYCGSLCISPSCVVHLMQWCWSFFSKNILVFVLFRQKILKASQNNWRQKLQQQKSMIADARGESADAESQSARVPGRTGKKKAEEEKKDADLWFRSETTQWLLEDGNGFSHQEIITSQGWSSSCCPVSTGRTLRVQIQLNQSGSAN